MLRHTAEIGPEAQAVVDRLGGVATSRSVDRFKIESALAAHIGALGMEPRPVNWAEADSASPEGSDAMSGFLAAWETLWHHRKGVPMVGSTTTASFAALHGKGLRAGGLLKDADSGEKRAGRSVKRDAHHASKAARKMLAPTVERITGTWDVGVAARSALATKGIHEKVPLTMAAIGAQSQAHGRAEGELSREISAANAAEAAAEAAAWLARAHVLRAAGISDAAIDRMVSVHLPLVDAVESGLRLFWVLPDRVVAVGAEPPRA